MRPFFLSVLLAGTSLTAACTSQSPSSPAPAGSNASTVAAGGGAAIPRGSEGAHGLVTALTGSCPDVSFTLGSRKVRTTAATVFHGGTCADVQNGREAASHGASGADGSLLAAAVTIRGVTRPPVPARMPAVGGSVAGLTGSCPAVSFSLGQHRVTANASTKFEGKACADLRNADRVHVTGTLQPDRSLLATTVRTGSSGTSGR